MVKDKFHSPYTVYCTQYKNISLEVLLVLTSQICYIKIYTRGGFISHSFHSRRVHAKEY